MKTYKEYKKVFIGDSDRASLYLIGLNSEDQLYKFKLNFGEDGQYKAYVLDSYGIIGDHYKNVVTFKGFMYVYDDSGLTFVARSEKINVYRAGEMGCIIQCLS